MCGIAGIVNIMANSGPFKNIQQMTAALRHRGPDDEGYAFFSPCPNSVAIYGGVDTPQAVYHANRPYTPNRPIFNSECIEATLALGHRRLSILDLSPSGHQPMCTPDKRYWIVYNGEIYNYIELREKLANKGYRFVTGTDTEVLLTAYAHWRTEALKHLVGMFAFAIYDCAERSLFLARDFFGIKPLFYTTWPEGFAFASEIKALLSLPHIQKTANPVNVYEYLVSGRTDHGENTMLSEIKQILPAHFLTIKFDQSAVVQPVRYWDIDLDQHNDISFAKAADNLRELFFKNIEMHMRSDVPVGSSFSGGIDSSAIVSGIKTFHGDIHNLHTFSYIADDPKVSEEKWVDIVCRENGFISHKVRPQPRELLSDLDDLIEAQDEPFNTISIYAQNRVMRLSKEAGIKVMLDGQGADELLAGYPVYWGARLADLIRSFRWLKALKFMRNSVFNNQLSATNNLINTGKYFLPDFLDGYARKMIDDDPTPHWIDKIWLQKFGIRPSPSRIKIHKNIFRKELYRSILQGRLLSFLRYEDRNAMAHSIESRVPFLTPDLVNFILSLPEEYIIDNSGITKAVFRAAMRGIVPDDILNRTDKIGFRTPDFRWIKSIKHWVNDVLSGESAHEIPILNQKQLMIEWERILQGLSPFNYHVWRWINLIKWSDCFHIRYN